MSDAVIKTLMDRASEIRRVIRNDEALLEEAKAEVESLEQSIIRDTQAADDLEKAANRLREAYV